MRREVKIGIFAVVVLFLLYWGVNFLKGKDLFGRSQTFYAYYDNVSGIQTSAAVVVRGMNAGSVTKMTFRPERNNTVELELNIKSAYRIPDDSVVRLVSSSIIGGKSLEIELGASPTFLPEGATIKSESESSFLDMAGSEFEFFKKRAGQLITQLDVTLTGINSILTDNKGLIDGTLQGLNRGATAFGDKADELAQTIDNINTLSAALAGSSGKIASTIDNVEALSGDLAQADIAGTLARLDDAVAGIDDVVAKLNSGDGSLGLLLSDRALYDSLTTASENLASVLADIKANPGRYIRLSVFAGE